MRVRFLQPAEAELDDAFEYYQSVYDGLGFRFLEQVSASLKRIQQFPNSYQQVGLYANRCLVNKFPYGVIYQLRADEILVVAIAHLHRKPEYWRSRETQR